MYKKRSDIFDSSFIYFMIIAAFVVIRIFSSTFATSNVMGYILNAFIQVGLMFSMPIFGYTFFRRQRLRSTFRQYSFNKISFKTVILCVVVGVFVYLTTIFIATFFSAILSLFGYQSSGSSAVTSYPLWLLFIELFVTAVLPGICEEVAHRGMLLSTFKKFGMKKAIILTGLLFGLMHLNIEQFFYTSIIGMFLAYLVLLSGSIYPAMIIHFMNNAISVVLGYSSANNLPISTYLNNFVSSVLNQNALLGILSLFFTVLIFVSIILMLTVIIVKDTKINQIKSVADEVVKKQLRDEIMQGISDDDDQSVPQNVEVIPNVVGEKRIYNIILKNAGLVYGNYKASFKEMVFIYSSFFVGIVTTICTFIWGII